MAERAGLGAPAERNDPGTLRVGSIGGVDVMVRASWLLVTALIAILVAPRIDDVSPGLGAWKYVAGVAFAVMLTLSVLLHEMSHALMAKRYGIGVRSITLHFIGGVTAMDGEPATPRQELVISAVGPLTSLGIGALAAGLWLVMTPVGLLSWAVGGLAGVNIIVGALNLVPGMPLDGGRVLRAAVWKVTGSPHRGTAVAGWAGRGVAVLVLSSPVAMTLLQLPTKPIDFAIALVLGWFLWSSASAAIVSARVRSRLPALKARALARRMLTAPEDLPLAEAIRLAHHAGAGSIVTLDSQGRAVGVVNEAAAAATPVERRPWVTVGAVSRTLEPGLSLPADIEGERLVMAMQSAPASEYLLVEHDGSIYGVLNTSDVDKAFDATG